MASINGISIRGMKTFKGHEGEPLCQGTLCLNGKKIGFWSQDSWGGPDNVQLDPGYDERLLNEVVHNLNLDKDYHGKAQVDGREFVLEYNLERLMGDYVPLYEDEKVYKNALKKGYAGVVVASDGYHQVSWALGASFMSLGDDELLKALESDINNAKNSFLKENEYTQHTVKIYRSPGDFIVGEPIDPLKIVCRSRLQDTIDSCERASEKASAGDEKDNYEMDAR